MGILDICCYPLKATFRGNLGTKKIQQRDSRIVTILGPDADAKRQKNDKGEKGEKGEVMSLEQVLAKRKEENKVPIRRVSIS